jgi:hypothetical protein
LEKEPRGLQFEGEASQQTGEKEEHAHLQRNKEIRDCVCKRVYWERRKGK